MELNIRKIERYLELKKISGVEFSQAIGISYSAWNNIKAKGTASFKVIEKIAKFMNEDALALFISNIAIEDNESPEELSFITARANEFLDINKIKVSELAEMLHIPIRTLRHQLTNDKITLSTLAAMFKLFNDVNIAWFFKANEPFSNQFMLASEPEVSYSSESKIIEKLNEIQKLIENKL